MNFIVMALLLLLAGGILLTGCVTGGDSDGGAHDHSSGHGACH